MCPAHGKKLNFVQVTNAVEETFVWGGKKEGETMSTANGKRSPTLWQIPLSSGGVKI